VGVDPELGGGGEETVCRDVDAVVVLGHLEQLGRRFPPAVQPDDLTDVEVPGLPLRHVGGYAGQQLAEFLQVAEAETRDHDEVLAAVLPHPGGDGLDDVAAAVRLHLDDHEGVREGVEHLFQGRDADALAAERMPAVGTLELVAGVEFAQLRDRHVDDGAAAVGLPVHGPVVVEDHLAVGGQLHVHLEGVGPQFERQLERLQGVRRRMTLRARVRDVGRAVIGEVREGVLRRRRQQWGDEDPDGEHRQQQPRSPTTCPAAPRRLAAIVDGATAARLCQLTGHDAPASPGRGHALVGGRPVAAHPTRRWSWRLPGRVVVGRYLGSAPLRASSGSRRASALPRKAHNNYIT
jgi:hypothetical protein